ncbi:hypothetical protein SO802_034198 [Lithocarpus litseifolius]|uniref:SHSP domain-containing protein n=1 Tax=Lithocarpus litseifolius TaxID=425828 RepID=A0AAW2BGX8_9ROSI
MPYALMNLDGDGIICTLSSELYGKNNPFQRSGPKGAVERIALKNDKLYMRVDMPGVPAPKEWEHDDQVREFGGLYGLRCGCCKVAKLHGNITNASHPYQTKGPRESYGAKEVKDGFYVWVDMPGVTKDKVSVGVENGWVLFSGKAGKESIHEESGRNYQGRFGPFDVNMIGKIKTEVKNGVLRMMIPEIGEE